MPFLVSFRSSGHLFVVGRSEPFPGTLCEGNAGGQTKEQSNQFIGACRIRWRVGSQNLMAHFIYGVYPLAIRY